MSEVKAGIGTIKFLDPETKKRGVIAPQQQKDPKGPSRDVYFEVSDDEALRLREGQLVQYVLKDADDEAKEVTVLSNKA